MTVAWPFKPQMEVVEGLEWKTDIHKCRTSEKRRSLRPFPRITYQFEYILDDVDYGIARELARTIGGDDVYVPDWPTATQVPTISSATVSLPVDVTRAPAYKVNGFALVWGSNTRYEVVTVTSIGTGTIGISATASGYTTPWVAPLRVGTFVQEFKGDRGPHDYTEAGAELQCLVTENLAASSGGPGYPTYLGDDLVTSPVEIINGVSESNLREVELIDSQTGPVYRYPLYATPNQAGVLAWTAQNAIQLWALRVWLHTRKGRWKQFWTSSWNADVTITKNIAAGDGSIQIAAIGFASKYPANTDLVVVNASNGGAIQLRVVSVTAGPPGHEVLNWDGGVWSGSTWNMEDLTTSKLTLSRLGADRIEIQHLPGRQATIVAATKEVPVYP